MKVKTILLDIGNVLLSNGWDMKSRKVCAKQFDFDYEEFAERHEYLSALYEEGKITLDDYLEKTVFFVERSFSKTDLKNFIFSRSTPFNQMIRLFSELKAKYGLKLVALSNEGLEICNYRIRTFNLDKLFDILLSSCFVHLRKPDERIYELALNLSFSRPDECIFIDDRYFNVETAVNLGIPAFRHTGYLSTKEELARYSLVL